MYSDRIYKWLNNALDIGITENDFWDMTFAELERIAASKTRVRKRELQEKATLDYTLADMIGKSVARIYNSTNKMPEIYEVYPTLFDSKAIIQKRQEKQAELSAIRFKLFAQSFNKKLEDKNKEQ